MKESDERKAFRMNCPCRGLRATTSGLVACLTHDINCSSNSLCPRMMSYDRDVLGINHKRPTSWGEDVFDVTLEDEYGDLIADPSTTDAYDQMMEESVKRTNGKQASDKSDTYVNPENPLESKAEDTHRENKQDTINNLTNSINMVMNIENCYVPKGTKVEAMNIENLNINGDNCQVFVTNVENLTNNGNNTNITTASQKFAAKSPEKKLHEYTTKELVEELRRRDLHVICLSEGEGTVWY